MNKKEQIVEVGGKKYRLGKLDARSASYLALKFAAILMPAMNGGGLSLETIGSTLPALSRVEFDEIQTMILRTVVRLNEMDGQLLPEPILKADGTFADPEMEYDVATVFSLTGQAIHFNIGGFFQEVASSLKAKSK